MRVKITLACTECKQRNYNTMKNKKNNAVRLNFFDTENYESMISEIEIFKEKHKKIAVVIFDEEDRELTETLNNYKSCFK